MGICIKVEKESAIKDIEIAVQIIKKIEEYLLEINKDIEFIIESLWKHKLACFKRGNKINYVDSSKYSLIKDTLNYKEFESIEEKDLLLKLKNINL